MDWELIVKVDTRLLNVINISHHVCLSGCFTSHLPIPGPSLFHYYVPNVSCLVAPNCYIGLICYLDVDL